MTHVSVLAREASESTTVFESSGIEPRWGCCSHSAGGKCRGGGCVGPRSPPLRDGEVSTAGGAGPVPPAVAVPRIGSVTGRRFIAASMAADPAGVVMLVAWPMAGLAFTSLLLAVYTGVGVNAFRRAGGGDCKCLGARLDARSPAGLIARNF
jgi:Methylamine utilisation protein MauE